MHKNHRERLKNRFLAEGLDGFEPHNVLELLLFYGIPQKDTNELAHTLINRFGSLSAVFDAPYEELITVPGIKEHSATLIKMIPQLSRRYFFDKNVCEKTLDSTEKLGEYFVNKYIGATVETVYLLLLDNKYEPIECILIHEGAVNSAAITTRRLVELALFRRASMAVLAHNHPNGLPIPSMEDIYTTKDIARAFELLDIHFMAHILVAGDRYADILQSGCL
ncbi:MAG: RadC family protein [Clostridia bacterium]|nr:RadC family protein [Clostridia bacterium]